jgi:GTP cyclohydrolase IA
MDITTQHPFKKTSLSSQDQIQKVTELMTEVLQTLGLDLSHSSLKETPYRIAKMYVQEIFSGLDPKNFPKVTLIENDMNYHEMVLVNKIQLISLCEHHFMPIHGYATVAYIPQKKVIGLSKINRIVNYFARRPQVQERLTKQIADCLQQILETDHVAVHIQAHHYCVIARGIQDQDSMTTTSDLRGDFKTQSHTRSEFLLSARNSLSS